MTPDVKMFDIKNDKDATEMFQFILEMLADGYSVAVKNDRKSDLIHVDPYIWRRFEDGSWIEMSREAIGRETE